MKMSKKYAIVFSINEDILPRQVTPNNGRTFDLSEIFDLLNVPKNVNDLDRIEIFGGALYLNPENKIFNRSASEFWFNNSPHFDRDYLTGTVLFIPKPQDVYQGRDQII